jgi:hypothetical protein
MPIIIPRGAHPKSFGRPDRECSSRPGSGTGSLHVPRPWWYASGPYIGRAVDREDMELVMRKGCGWGGTIPCSLCHGSSYVFDPDRVCFGDREIRCDDRLGIPRFEFWQDRAPPHWPIPDHDCFALSHPVCNRTRGVALKPTQRQAHPRSPHNTIQPAQPVRADLRLSCIGDLACAMWGWRGAQTPDLRMGSVLSPS